MTSKNQKKNTKQNQGGGEKNSSSQNKAIHQPQDGLFKYFMSIKQNALDLFSLTLEPEIWKRVNKNVMELCPQSYVDNKLKHKHVDVLYRTEFDHQPGYFYILSENQSKPDKKMPLRMMQYILRIIEHHQKQFHTQEFPLVYPIIYYVSSKPYPYSTSFFEGFGDNEALAKEILVSPFTVRNICGVTEEELKAHPLAGTLARVYQLVQHRDALKILQSLKDEFLYIDLQVSSDFILTMLEYILGKVSVRTDISADDVLNSIANMVTVTTEKKVMNLAQQLENRGRQEGIQQGMQQGSELEKIKIAESFLMQGIDENIVAIGTDLPLDKISEIKARLNLTSH